MANPALYEAQAPVTEPEVLTLDSLNRKVESLAENINAVYESAVRHTDERLMHKGTEDQARDHNVAHGFHMVNASIASFAAQFDVVFKELDAKLEGSEYKDLLERSKVKTEEIIAEQEKAIQEIISRQQAQQEAALQEAGGVPTPNLTEVPE